MEKQKPTKAILLLKELQLLAQFFIQVFPIAKSLDNINIFCYIQRVIICIMKEIKNET